jgi:hypothetical protein
MGISMDRTKQIIRFLSYFCLGTTEGNIQAGMNKNFIILEHIFQEINFLSRFATPKADFRRAKSPKNQVKYA